MSNYNSENTHILATHEQSGGNTRMLLMHECESPNRPYEFVIGSYFKQHHYDGALGYERWDYSWDWGHYFSSVVDAVDYWQREVAADLLEGFEVHAGTPRCPRCGEPLEPSDLPEYKYVCYGCDENFYGFEAKFEVK